MEFTQEEILAVALLQLVEERSELVAETEAGTQVFVARRDLLRFREAHGMLEVESDPSMRGYEVNVIVASGDGVPPIQQDRPYVMSLTSGCDMMLIGLPRKPNPLFGVIQQLADAAEFASHYVDDPKGDGAYTALVDAVKSAAAVGVKPAKIY